MNGGFAVLFAVLAAAVRRPEAWTPHGEGEAQSIHEAMSRVQTALRGKLPRGLRLVEVTRQAYRLNPAVSIGEIAWDRMATHPDERIQKVARLRRASRSVR